MGQTRLAMCCNKNVASEEFFANKILRRTAATLLIEQSVNGLLGFRFATESTLLQMIGFIIWLAILPHFPDDSEPAVGQDAIGVSVRIAVGANVLPVRRRPTGLELGGSRKLHGETTELAVAPVTEPDDLPLATALCHGAGARESLDISGLGEAIPVIAELEQARDQEVAGTWQ